MKLILFVLMLMIPSTVGAITLNWSDNSNNEDGFNIERLEAISGTPGVFTPLTPVGVNVTTYVDNTGTPGVNYCYRVNAFNLAGISAWSNQACAVQAVPLTPPNVPSGLMAIP